MKKIILAFILGAILTGSVAGVVAYNYNAKDVSYNNTTVESALKDLYTKVGRIGNVYSSYNYGPSRLSEMSTELRLENPGKYLCNASFTLASTNNNSDFDYYDKTQRISINGCQTINYKDNYTRTNGSNTSINTNTYAIVQESISTFECEIPNSSTITTTIANNPAPKVPWSMYLNCISIN